MQIEIYTPTKAQPLPPVEWNYTEVRQWVEDGLGAYKGRVYTDETISQAKADRATLNKLSKAIDAKRKELKAVYLAPYGEFEVQAKELVSMIDKQSREIDAQIKTYDRQRREEKLEKIKTELYAPLIGGLAEAIPYEKLHDPKWLNVTFSMAAVSEPWPRRSSAPSRLWPRRKRTRNTHRPQTKARQRHPKRSPCSLTSGCG